METLFENLKVEIPRNIVPQISSDLPEEITFFEDGILIGDKIFIYSYGSEKVAATIYLTDEIEDTKNIFIKINYDDSDEDLIMADIVRILPQEYLSEDEIKIYTPLRYNPDYEIKKLKNEILFKKAKKWKNLPEFDPTPQPSDITLGEVEYLIEPFAKRYRKASGKQKDTLIKYLGDSPLVIEILNNINFEQAKILLEELEKRQRDKHEKLIEQKLKEIREQAVKEEEKIQAIQNEAEEQKGIFNKYKERRYEVFMTEINANRIRKRNKRLGWALFIFVMLICYIITFIYLI